MKYGKITPLIVLGIIFLSSSILIGNTDVIAEPINEVEEIKIDKNLFLLDYEIPEFPDEDIPDWEINITGIGIDDPVTLSLSYLIDQVNTSQLDAYEEIVDYKGSTQTVIGFDILQLVQDYADVWYAGVFEFKAEDGYSKSLNATEILYSYFPPALENADIKILLVFAVNGSYLPNTDWADEGALRLVCPSNQVVDYWSSYWVGNVTEISIADKWKCDVFVNGELEDSIYVGEPTEFADYDYLEYNLTYKEENVEFEGPSILSIIEHVGVNFDDITLFQAQAPDSLATINKTELVGTKPTILAMAGNDEYFGFNRGPMRLIGGNLNGWNWLKNCYAIHITTDTSSPTTNVPGFSTCIAIISLMAIPITIKIYKKRK